MEGFYNFWLNIPFILGIQQSIFTKNNHGTYGWETWTLVVNGEESRASGGSEKCCEELYRGIVVAGFWRQRTNREIADLCNEPKLVSVIRSVRIGCEWAEIGCQKL